MQRQQLKDPNLEACQVWLTEQLLQEVNSLLPLLPLLHQTDASGGHGSVHPGRGVAQEEGQLGGGAGPPTGGGLLLVQVGVNGCKGGLQGLVCCLCVKVLRGSSASDGVVRLHGVAVWSRSEEAGLCRGLASTSAGGCVGSEER